MDLDTVEAQVDRVVNARAAVMKEEILLRARIMALLTPEQRASLEELFQDRRQMFRESRQRRERQPRYPPTDPPPDEEP